MSKDRDARGRSAAPAGPDTAGGLHENTHRMKWILHAPGWPANPAFAREGSYVGKSTRLPLGRVLWRCFNFKELRLSASAALLILQGMPIKDIFPPDASLIEEPDEGAMVIHTGPFIFLKGTFDSLHSPVCIHDMVVAGILEAPKGVEEKVLLGALLEEVLAAS